MYDNWRKKNRRVILIIKIQYKNINIEFGTLNCHLRLLWLPCQSIRMSRVLFPVFILRELYLVRINLLFYLFFTPSSHLTLVCFFPIGLSLLIQHFQQVLKFLLSPGLDRRNFKTRWKCCINNERPTGKKKTCVRWDDGEK